MARNDFALKGSKIHRITCKRIANQWDFKLDQVDDKHLAEAQIASCCKPNAAKVYIEEAQAALAPVELTPADVVLGDEEPAFVSGEVPADAPAEEVVEAIETVEEELGDVLGDITWDEDGVTPVDENVDGDHPELDGEFYDVAEEPTSAPENAETATDGPTLQLVLSYLVSGAPRYRFTEHGAEAGIALAEALGVEAAASKKDFTLTLVGDPDAVTQVDKALRAAWPASVAAMKAWRKTDETYQAAPGKFEGAWYKSERYALEQEFLASFVLGVSMHLVGVSPARDSSVGRVQGFQWASEAGL